MLTGTCSITYGASKGGLEYLSPDNTCQPRLDHVVPLGPLADVQDACSGGGGRSGILQIPDLKDELHVGQQADALIGWQCEQAVVVHHTVHALNPAAIMHVVNC